MKKETDISNDEELLERIKGGDLRAFDDLFRKYYVDIVMFNWQFVSNKEDAEDIAQSVFLHLWEQREDTGIQSGVRSYLIKSAQNACLNFIRHKKIISQYNSEYLTLLPYKFGEKADGILLYSELVDLINRGEDSLSEKEREVWNLSRHAGMKYSEIAIELGLSVRAVEKRMANAKRHFRLYLNRHWPWILITPIITLTQTYGLL